MKLLCKLFLVVAVVISCAGFSMAQERFAGVKSGLMMIDANNVDDIIPIGLVYGHSLENVLANLWVEGEFNYGLAGGDFPGGSLDAWTIAAYGAYRYPVTDAAYLKGKLGILYESVTVDFDNWGSDTETDTGLSFGIGGGMRINDKMAVEAEFTVIESDINYFSVGLNYYF